MGVDWGSIGQASIIGAVLMGLITYSANVLNNPGLASIITAFPIGILSMWFQRKNLGIFGYDTTLTNLTVVAAYLVFDFLIKRYTPHHALIGAIIAWVICSAILHYSQELK